MHLYYIIVHHIQEFIIKLYQLFKHVVHDQHWEHVYYHNYNARILFVDIYRIGERDFEVVRDAARDKKKGVRCQLLVVDAVVTSGGQHLRQLLRSNSAILVELEIFKVDTALIL